MAKTQSNLINLIHTRFKKLNQSKRLEFGYLNE